VTCRHSTCNGDVAAHRLPWGNVASSLLALTLAPGSVHRSQLDGFRATGFGFLVRRGRKSPFSFAPTHHRTLEEGADAVRGPEPLREPCRELQMKGPFQVVEIEGFDDVVESTLLEGGFRHVLLLLPTDHHYR
jgi:hypothetical protein